MNRLYYGDCLTVMQEYMRSDSVDLIYLDPPFNSNREYNQIYKDETGRPLPDQIDAFCDLWTLDEERERAIRSMPVLMREAGIDDSVAAFWRLWMNALRETNPRLLAYLSYMVERLLYLKSILKPTGSVYLHCDPTASHYIKVMLDGIFGHTNFRNEVIWHYSKWSNAARFFQRNHDVLLMYSASSKYVFNKQYELSPDKAKKLAIGYQVNRPQGIKQLIVYDRLKAAEKIRQGNYDRIVYRDKENPGRLLHDTWHDINILNSQAKERLGYSTQKPLKLLERIITASSNEGDVVFDPFCGCATTLEAAHIHKRRWIGIDIAIHAIKRVAALRLRDKLALVEGVDFLIEGVPRNLEGAHDLWERDTYHFQKWAVEEVDGFVTVKKTADGGIDGRLYFDCPGKPDLQSMAIEVKGGKHVGIKDLRALHGVVENDLAMMGGLIVLEPLRERRKKNFRREMASAGDVQIGQAAYPMLQLLTVEEILNGKRFDTPGAVGRGLKQPQLRLQDKA